MPLYEYKCSGCGQLNAKQEPDKQRIQIEHKHQPLTTNHQP